MEMLRSGLEIPIPHRHSLHIWYMYAGVIAFRILFGLGLKQNPQQFCNSDMPRLLEGVTKNYPLESVVPQQIILIEDALIALTKSLSSKMTNVTSLDFIDYHHSRSPIYSSLNVRFIGNKIFSSTFMMPPKAGIT